MLPEEYINLSQLSVSMHSLRAISNFESISARLWGYCASDMLANTLDEDFLIWYTVLESILYSLQSFAISQANCSEYSSNKFFDIYFSFRLQITALAVNGIRNLLRYGIARNASEWNQLAELYGIKPQEDKDARLRVMPSAFGDSIQCASALMPYQACGLDKKITSELKSSDVIFFGDPYGNRTHAFAVRGRRLSRLTKGPCLLTCIL